VKLVAHIDGGSRGNPGPAAVGVVVEREGTRLFRAAVPIGTATNNEAEYKALLLALGYSTWAKATSLKVYSDSQLLVRQLRGEYAVHNERLKLLYNEAVGLTANLETFEVEYIPREQNQEADALVNEALDGATTAGKGGL